MQRNQYQCENCGSDQHTRRTPVKLKRGFGQVIDCDNCGARTLHIATSLHQISRVIEVEPDSKKRRTGRRKYRKSPSPNQTDFFDLV